MDTMFGLLKVGDIFYIEGKRFIKIEKIYTGCCSILYTAQSLDDEEYVFINHNYLVQLENHKRE
jgi:hypothetical protein